MRVLRCAWVRRTGDFETVYELETIMSSRAYFNSWVTNKL
ncbi:hypothetical protein SAMN05444000_106123 [Shimia gijangensis]|uniref:Uncharacterized protein n=1 Tax=Shimia gijangensis TaxID=1470563 RepID=A0A1M6HR52_9RHOB|nr:hypothetical protein SAMN05444000_106123 [Shimia gijangensis]